MFSYVLCICTVHDFSKEIVTSKCISHTTKSQEMNIPAWRHMYFQASKFHISHFEYFYTLQNVLKFKERGFPGEHCDCFVNYQRSQNCVCWHVHRLNLWKLEIKNDLTNTQRKCRNIVSWCSIGRFSQFSYNFFVSQSGKYDTRNMTSCGKQITCYNHQRNAVIAQL